MPSNVMRLPFFISALFAAICLHACSIEIHGASTQPAVQVLTGDVIGTPGSWQNKGNTIAKAVDGKAGDYFDAPGGDGVWVGLDLKSQFIPGSVSFAPRDGFPSRLVGGQMQGANKADFTDAVVLLKITTAPKAYATYSLSTTGAYRYVRYLSPPGGNGNISRLSFSGVPLVVATPTAEIAGSLGINAAGVDDSMIDLAAHPQLLKFCQPAKITSLRVWHEGGWKDRKPAAYYHLLAAWHDAGVQMIIVANFQNSTPRNSVPSDADWSGWCTALPPPSVTNAWAIEIGNEINTGAYYTGTAQQLTHLMQIAYPILHAKGYAVIAPSTLNSLNENKSLVSLGAYKYADYFNIHSYRGSAAAIAADVDAAQALATSVGKPLAVTEWSVMLSGAAPNTWAAEQAKAVALLRQRSTLSLIFPLYIQPSQPAYVAAPFDTKGAINQPFYDALIGASK